MLVSDEGGNRSTRKKPLGAEWRTNKLNPHIASSSGIDPGPRWWEARALTTAPTLLVVIVRSARFANQSQDKCRQISRDIRMLAISGNWPADQFICKENFPVNQAV